MKTAELVIREADDSCLRDCEALNPFFRRILAARGVQSIDEIDYRLQNIIPLESIRNLSSAADLLTDLIKRNKTILVFGDYDADGATSTAVCMRAFSLMGYGHVNYLMPDRIADGYGLSLSVAERIVKHPPDCLITVDNGIASIDGIDLMRRHGVEVIVTDHHLAGESLPNASVIVNQNAWQGQIEGRNLAGVGIAFYLMLALRARLRESGWFSHDRPEPNLASCLDLVAIGTVADLVPLDYCNRIFIHEGLKRIRAGFCTEGIKALIEVGGKQLDNFTSVDIAFTLAPRINAAGRLDDMTVGVQCLLADSGELAVDLAEELNSINLQRRELQQQMAEQADRQLTSLDQTVSGNQKSIVLFQADWHEGVVGIVASKLKEKYARPSIVFAQSEDGRLKGSGRSIAGIHLRDMLDVVDKRIPGSIVKFGGHAMAAGLTLENASLQLFTDTFESVIHEFSDPACFNNIIECDGELEDQQVDLQLAIDLQNLSPWGQHFPTPTFVGEFQVINQRVLKQQHLKLTLELAGQNYVDGIAFFQPPGVLNKQYEKIIIHYELAVNQFRGTDSVQLLIRDIF
jgi:single-stranded-DNA-specific exonuclease